MAETVQDRMDRKDLREHRRRMEDLMGRVADSLELIALALAGVDDDDLAAKDAARERVLMNTNRSDT